MSQNRVLLCILDGWGVSEKTEFNAVKTADTPNYDNFLKNMSTTTIHADGLNVGLPEEQMGNSEVGHLNISRCFFNFFLGIPIAIKIPEFLIFALK